MNSWARGDRTGGAESSGDALAGHGGRIGGEGWPTFHVPGAGTVAHPPARTVLQVAYNCRVNLKLGAASFLMLMAIRASPVQAQGAPPSIPAAPGRPALVLPANAPLAELRLLDFMQVGLRVSWQAGDAVVAGVGGRLVPSPDGDGTWVDKQSGMKVRTSGGVGYHQANFISASSNLVAIDARNYPIIDIERNVAIAGGAIAARGNAVSIGIYWIHPRLLALLGTEGAPGQREGIRIERGPYPFQGRQVESVTIHAEYPMGLDRTVYDSVSGFLIFRSTSSRVEGERTAVSHLLLLGARRVGVPWLADAPPAWVAKGTQLHYRGSSTAMTSMGALPSRAVAMTIRIGEVTDGVASGQVTTAFDTGTGLPAPPGVEERVFASGMFDPIWISPASLARLRAGQVLDEDPVTRIRTIFEGAQGGVAAILEQGPSESVQYIYDGGNGMLAGIRSVRQEATGQIQSELALVR